MVILFRCRIAYDCKRQNSKRRHGVRCACVCIKTMNAASGRLLSMFKCEYIIKLNGKTGNGIKRNANEIKKMTQEDKGNSIARGWPRVSANYIINPLLLVKWNRSVSVCAFCVYLGRKQATQISMTVCRLFSGRLKGKSVQWYSDYR